MRRLMPLALLLLLVAPAWAGDEPQPEQVEVSTPDGMRLAGTYYPPQGRPAKGAPSVVALHMYRNQRTSYAPIADAIAAEGMGLLTIDLRGHGESKVQGGKDLSIAAVGRDPELFNVMHQDAWAAVMWLRRHKQVPKGKFALLGASVGCSVAIDTAVRNPAGIACVATLTPGLNYLGVPTAKHAKKWPRGKPLFLIASEGEKKLGAGPLHATLEHRGAEILVFPGGRELHGTRMFGKVEGIEKRVAAWLRAKTDGVDVTDKRVRAHERHGRHVEVLGKRVECVLGTSGSDVYAALVPAPDANAPSDAKLVLEVLDAQADKVRKSLRFGAALGRAWRIDERRIPREKLGVAQGETFRLRFVLQGKRRILSRAVTVVLP